MHVCFLSTYFPRPCGIASYTHYLAEALCAVPCSPRVTVLAESPSQSCRLFPVMNTFTAAGDYPSDVLSKARALAPDLVHVKHEYGIFGIDDRFPTLLTRLRKLGIHAVVTLHTVHTRLSFNAGCARPHSRRQLRKVDVEAYQRRIGELADMVIVHQNQPIRQVLLRQGVPPQRVVTVPHGTRLAVPDNAAVAKQALGINPTSPLILAFGYFEPSKNYYLLLEAFRRVKARVPQAKLWLSGYVRFGTSQSQAIRLQCLKRIAAYGLLDDVIFLDHMIPEERVPELLAAADVACFVYNEDTRSSSGALHLAMGLGKAVVASRISKFQELSGVSDEVLVNPRSAGELCRVLIRLLTDQPFRRSIEHRIDQSARRTAWSNVARRHHTLYERLVRHGRVVQRTDMEVTTSSTAQLSLAHR